jgi:hypothetical protein
LSWSVRIGGLWLPLLLITLARLCLRWLLLSLLLLLLLLLLRGAIGLRLCLRLRLRVGR